MIENANVDSFVDLVIAQFPLQNAQVKVKQLAEAAVGLSAVE